MPKSDPIFKKYGFGLDQMYGSGSEQNTRNSTTISESGSFPVVQAARLLPVQRERAGERGCAQRGGDAAPYQQRPLRLGRVQNR